MSLTTLYDVPGPRARRRSLIGTVIALLVFAALAVLALRRLGNQGQLDSELWGPLVDPRDERFSRVWELLLDGLLATLASAAVAVAASLVIGTFLGVARMRLAGPWRLAVVTWIELFRGLPVVITIVFVWRAFVELGIDLEPLPGAAGFWYLVIGLTLYNSVVIAEVLRAGVAALPRGQAEAAKAVGMRDGQIMRTIQLPQAFRSMLPAIISQLVVVVKDTSLVAVAGAFYIEMLRRGNLLSQTLDNPIQTLTVVGAIFIILNYLLSRLAISLERRVGQGGRKSVAVSTM
ncbi:amino acid ABC transporter permease [Nocardioides marmotae]|uniref:amino acid ABC transporter permease n=1 Tax=Nocardioides marmotae TaxID=2663857 RepID=UPI0012B5C22B|nr:amino acid ABC transporter permease [Nocardioides marmotae]MBC9733852.1 amino acid ABC transporter permease [Nocardioides marmotae]MTB84954.1 ABC transporter permease subunit [Nocardioides marmotae]